MKTFRRLLSHQRIVINSLLSTTLLFIGMGWMLNHPYQLKSAALPASALTQQAIAQTSNANLPLHFEANQGQADGDVKYFARGAGYALALRPDEAQLRLSNADKSATVTMKLLGAQTQPTVTGEEELPGKINYLLDNDQQKWQTNVPTFAQVRYAAVYPGIDLVYYGKQQKLEYDFVVAPGADPHAIRLQFVEASALKLDDAGNLLLQTAAGEIRQERPVVYQEKDGTRQPITGSYVITNRNEVQFALGD